jgi:hypothetical protein
MSTALEIALMLDGLFAISWTVLNPRAIRYFIAP